MTVALSTGIPVLLIDTLTSTSDTKGSGFAIPQKRDGAKGIVWQTVVVGSPSALNVTLEMADNDVDGEYATMDTSTVTGGERRQLPPEVNARFVRARQNSRTGGTSISVQILI